MNSRNSVNESNLVNFSTELTTLNQLDTKDGLLGFPFDHIYACHSEDSDRTQTLQLDKEVEVSTHCTVPEDKESAVSPDSEITRLSEKLTATEDQNKRLKDLLVYHLDLIQQQNELINKRDKLYQQLKLENETLKSRACRMDRRQLSASQKQSINPPPLVQVPQPSVSSTVVKTEPSSQILLNSFDELLLPENKKNSYIFDSELNKTKPFSRSTETEISGFDSNLGSSSILNSNPESENFTMIESKHSFIKKEIKTENRTDALYTVTSNSGNPVIQRIHRNRRRTTSSLGSMSRLAKNPAIKPAEPDTSKIFESEKPYERNYTVNKRSKMINTYGKSRTATSKRTSQFTGSLSDRLKLIDTTPTGEDPYQLGEADMREQSPIPKLMLQKTNHGRMKICTDTSETITSRRVYDPVNTKTQNKFGRYSLNAYSNVNKEEKPSQIDEPDLDLVKIEPEIDWRLYGTNKLRNETSLCDYSYGETPNNLASNILPDLDTDFNELFSSQSPLNLDNLPMEYSGGESGSPDKSKRRAARTTSLIGPNLTGDGTSDKRGRKRALSTTGLAKAKKEITAKPTATGMPKPKLNKGKAINRSKKLSFVLPGMTTNTPYHTLVGDPDLSWYWSSDPNVKLEDVDQGESQVSTVEVPRWREKPYTSSHSQDGIENLDDKVFEKRHQKLEAEERRQLRWHMRRVREQRHVERLKLRQRDPWCSGSASQMQASEFTVWPQPQRDARFIEITDTLPVMAFGEIVPALPESDFMLPWVRTSKALKRAKRSKTLL